MPKPPVAGLARLIGWRLYLFGYSASDLALHPRQKAVSLPERTKITDLFPLPWVGQWLPHAIPDLHNNGNQHVLRLVIEPAARSRRPNSQANHAGRDGRQFSILLPT